MGEALHGDYNRWVGEGKLHSCTNYECYKGLYSSLNSMNLFEIVHSLKRQFGQEQWTLYKGKHRESRSAQVPGGWRTGPGGGAGVRDCGDWGRRQ